MADGDTEFTYPETVEQLDYLPPGPTATTVMDWVPRSVRIYPVTETELNLLRYGWWWTRRRVFAHIRRECGVDADD